MCTVVSRELASAGDRYTGQLALISRGLRPPHPAGHHVYFSAHRLGNSTISQGLSREGWRARPQRGLCTPHRQCQGSCNVARNRTGCWRGGEGCVRRAWSPSRIPGAVEDDGGGTSARHNDRELPARFSFICISPNLMIFISSYGCYLLFLTML